MLVGCYVLHLYCDACGATWNNGNGTEQTQRQALTVARSEGWKISVGVWCPKHHPKRKPFDKAAQWV